MHGIKQMIKESSVNRTPIPGALRMRIWTGPSVDSQKRIFISKGYYKDTHTVYAVSKVKYQMLMAGNFHFEPETLEYARSIFKQNGMNVFNEIKRRAGIGATEPKRSLRDSKRNEFIGTSSKTKQAEHPEITRLIQLIAFFTHEVTLCTVDQYSINSLKEEPNASMHEVLATMRSDGEIDYKNVSIVYSSTFPRALINRVPTGGGETQDQMGARNVSVFTESVTVPGRGDETVARMKRAAVIHSSLYNKRECPLDSVNYPIDGDFWYGGIRSSISRGVYEVWADDLGGGPLVRRSRNSVYESAARYYKDINPTNQFYNGYRVNPLSTYVPSNAITPVKTYIEDWFGDPNIYAGIISALITLMSSSGDSKSVYDKRFLNAGTIDMGRIYNKYDGVEI